MRVVFVHGACVEGGEWWWSKTAGLLEGRGIASVSPSLPSCGEGGRAGSDGAGLPEDVAEVRRVLAEATEATIVVAHSYGGIVTAEAAADVDSVQHLLLISSYLPEIGQSLADFGGDQPAPFLDADLARGTFFVRPELLIDTFLQDCEPEIQGEASRHLARQSLKVTEQQVGAAAWKDIPSTYLVCADDRGTQAQRQREFARRAGRTVELKAGHHPFLSQPEAVRDLILSL